MDLENIEIKEIKQSDVEEFSNTQWDIVNKRYNFLPSRKTFFFGVYLKEELISQAKVELRGGCVETRDLLVKDGLYGNGIGGKFLKYIELFGKNNNCTKSLIKTCSVWEKSVNFYKKNDYKIDAVLPNYYYDRDWYYMSKKL